MNKESYRKRVEGCWLGKAIGGTLGMPFEGTNCILDLKFYDPVPKEMLPNDDLDLQVVWTCVLDKMDIPVVDKNILADAWLKHVNFPWDEYGVAIRNLKRGIRPPFSGSFDNWFINGMGAAIRSELWACLAAGNPKLAAKYAYEDACVDHAEEGIYAEIFLSALESLAFVENDIDKLLDAASIQLPVDSLVRRCITDTRIWYKQIRNWRAVRERILEHYGNENFTDVVMNLGFVVLGIIAGDGDFGETICIAVNCGMDTDCTGATAGAIMGILNPDGIDEKWLKPIGRNLVLSSQITGISAPADLDEFTDIVIRLRDRLTGREPQKTPDHLRPEVKPISAQVGFTDSPVTVDSVPTPDDGFRKIHFDGTFVRFPAGDCPKTGLIVKYRFNIEKKQAYRIFFNTPENCRVWIDGKYAFGRECGRMAPSAHRVPLNQSADMTLETGAHEIVSCIVKPQYKEYIEWVVGIADKKSYQWLTEVFE